MSKFFYILIAGSFFAACRREEPSLPSAISPLIAYDSSQPTEEPLLFSDLPTEMQSEIAACNSSTNFYNLSLSPPSCVTAEFPDFACTRNPELIGALSDKGRSDIESYYETKDTELKLYACTKVGLELSMYYYKVVDQTINYSILRLETRD